MFDRFTNAARKVIGLSRQESQRLEDLYLGTEHILLGLIAEGESLAAEVLRDLGADQERVSAQVKKIVQPGPARVSVTGQLPFTPRAKRVLEQAVEESKGLDDPNVRPEHLLLGVLGVDEGVAAQVLVNLDLRLDRVRDEVLSRLPAAPRADENAAPAHPANGLTLRAERTLALAREEAARLGHQLVGTEHLFLALLQQVDAAPAKILEARGQKVAELRAEVLALLGGA